MFFVSMYGRFNYADSACVGKPRYTAAVATPTEIKEADAALQRQWEAEDAAQEAKAQAEYDALPEEVKLARKIVGWLSDHNETSIENALSNLPLDVLKAVVKNMS
jgi:hypothetical protein